MSTPPYLRVEDLSVTFHAEPDPIEAVRRISFQVNEGETLAIVGESGSGKSVTALSIMQLLPYPKAFHPHGSIELEGEQILGADDRRLRELRGNSISMIFQEPMTSLNPLHTIEKQVSEVLSVHKGFSRSTASRRTLELLRLVGLQEAESRLQAWPHQLSGGQRQRVMIAMALANEPKLLIADEPTTALDVTVQAQILDLLHELQERLSMAMLLITHDLGVVRKMADRVCVMHEGVIVEDNDKRSIFSHPEHEYTRHLLEAEPTDRDTTPCPTAPIVLSAQKISVHFPIQKGVLRRTVDHVRAVDEVNIELREAHTLGIVGESGSGKTTLGLALLRLLKSKGKICFGERDIHEFGFTEMRPLRRELQIVFQDPFSSLNPRLSVGQIVEEGLLVHRLGGGRDNRRHMISSILDEVGIEPSWQDRYPHEFSGGQRQRIAIARAMILKPRCVVLDEPTSALDRSVQAQIVDLLRDLQRRHNLSYLFISHDLRVVRAMCDSIIVMRDGKVVEYGQTHQIFECPRSEYTRALIAAAFELETVEVFP